MFIPTTAEEIQKLGWDGLDVILVTGDTYIDSPYIGAAIIGKLLIAEGYRVGIIAQPDPQGDDICRLGEPALFWGVTGGSIDSMVANYTALKKRKKQDDLTPGGQNNRRPDRAVIVYSNLIRQHFKDTVPIVLGGLEASLRRIAHYDYWSDSIRRSILFDSRGDYLLYGMAESAVLELAARLRDGVTWNNVRDGTKSSALHNGSKPNILRDGVTTDASHNGVTPDNVRGGSKVDALRDGVTTDAPNDDVPVDDIRGLCWIAREPIQGAIELPPYETAASDKNAFARMFKLFYANNDPLTAQTLIQKQDTRWLVQNPPALPPAQKELDRYYELDYEYTQHPWYARMGSVKALDTIQFSLTTHRGCYGECNFCSITVHQGRTVTSRSEASLIREARKMTRHPEFHGTIKDVGGPTANMYGFECSKKLCEGSCSRRCMVPSLCAKMPVDHSRQRHLLKKLRSLPGVKHVFVASGIRYDLVMKDDRHGDGYLRDAIQWHTSGQMKIAPEHSDEKVLKLMGKPKPDMLLKFRDLFYKITKSARKQQYLTYYLIAAHPGCTETDMKDLKRFTGRKLRISPEQVQIFTPTPSTWSSLMYWTEHNPFTGEKIFVEKSLKAKMQQKQIITGSWR